MFDTGISDFLTVDINSPLFDLNGFTAYRDQPLNKILGRINRIDKNNDVPAVEVS